MTDYFEDFDDDSCDTHQKVSKRKVDLLQPQAVYWQQFQNWKAIAEKATDRLHETFDWAKTPIEWIGQVFSVVSC